MCAECRDPFTFDDPGNVPEGEYKMAAKTLSNAALQLPGTERPRLSAFAQEGDFTNLATLEGQEVLLHSFEEITTEFGTAYRTGATDEQGAVHVLCLGQQLVKPAIDAMIAHYAEMGEDVPFPVAVRFIKSGRTWTMV